MAQFALASFLDTNSSADWRNGFVIGSKYTRADVFRILGHPVNPVAQNVGGYLKDEITCSCPIFVTYHKADGISDTTRYEDRFLDPSTLHWFTKSNRSLQSPEIPFFLGVARGGENRLPLFVKKSDDEGLNFYYLGDITPLEESFLEDRMKDEDKPEGVPVVRMDMKLHDPVRPELYQYFVETGM